MIMTWPAKNRDVSRETSENTQIIVGNVSLRKKVIFKGYVQGVGFRYTTLRISKEYNVSGFVKNLPDRSVLLVAEGEKGEVDGLIKEIRGRKDMNIRSANEVSEPETGEFTSFEIQY